MGVDCFETCAFSDSLVVSQRTPLHCDHTGSQIHLIFLFANLLLVWEGTVQYVSLSRCWVDVNQDVISAPKLYNW
jgi:hypothetical protein